MLYGRRFVRGDHSIGRCRFHYYSTFESDGKRFGAEIYDLFIGFFFEIQTLSHSKTDLR